MWASGRNGDIRRAAHGYEPTREAAMPAPRNCSPLCVGLTQRCGIERVGAV
jgi:hypothetical protein